MKKGTKVIATPKGVKRVGTYVGVREGLRGNFLEVKLPDGKIVCARPSQVVPA